MRHILLIFLLASLGSCCTLKNNASDAKLQKDTYKNWALSRCLSKALPDEMLKQDALNSASAYLELSNLPIEAFNDADSLIDDFLRRNYQGSIPGTFNTKKCIDLFNSDELESLYQKKKIM